MNRSFNIPETSTVSSLTSGWANTYQWTAEYHGPLYRAWEAIWILSVPAYLLLQL